MSKIIVVQYLPGYSGDFICNLLHKNPGFLQFNCIPSTTNKYTLPKRLKNKDFNIKGEDLEKLDQDDKNFYLNFKRHMCIPSHCNTGNPDWIDHVICINKDTGDLDRKHFALFHLKKHPGFKGLNIDEYFERLAILRNEVIENWDFKSYFKNTINLTIDDILYSRKVKNILGFDLDQKMIDEYNLKNDRLLDFYGIDYKTDEKTFIETLALACYEKDQTHMERSSWCPDITFNEPLEKFL